MGWAAYYVKALQQGMKVSFRPHGSSMSGKIESGQLVTLEPVTEVMELAKGDIVLCKVNGKEYLHLISARLHNRYQIANNRGHVNGWIGRGAIYGKCIQIEP